MKLLKPIILYSSIFICAALAATSCSEENVDNSIKVTSMSFTETGETSHVSLYPGDTWTAKITLFPENATDKDEYAYRYTSSNESVFTVNEAGEVTAVGEGEATLTAWSTNNTDMWASCIIEVNKQIYSVSSIEIAEAYRALTLASGVEIDLGKEVSVFPENAWNTDVTFSSSDPQVVYVDNYGKITTKAKGNATITISSTDGSNVTTTAEIHVRDIAGYTDLDRNGWTVSTSHPTPTDGVVGGSAESLIDGDENSCILLVKPGKSLSGITVGKDEEVYFIIDMKEPKEFDFFRLRHRTYKNTTDWIRMNKVSVYGSNDGTNFTPISIGINIPTAADIAEASIPLPMKQTYQYFKLTCDGWHSSGNTVQASEFNLGTLQFAEN